MTFVHDDHAVVSIGVDGESAIQSGHQIVARNCDWRFEKYVLCVFYNKDIFFREIVHPANKGFLPLVAQRGGTHNDQRPIVAEPLGNGNCLDRLT